LNVQSAIYNATSRLRHHLFVSTQNGGGGRSFSSVLAGGQPTVAFSHGLNRHSFPGLKAPLVFCFLSAGLFSFPSFPYELIKLGCRQYLE